MCAISQPDTGQSPREVQRCRKCAGPLESGYIQAGIELSTPLTIYWHSDASEPGARGEALARQPRWIWKTPPRIRALHCPRCRLIEVNAGETQTPDAQTLPFPGGLG